MQAHDAADREAVDGINNGYAWKDVHETWERKTHRVLSPNAFGKYILGLSEGSGRKERHTPQAGASRSPAATAANDTRPPARPPSNTFTPITAHPPAHSPHFQHAQAPQQDGIDAQRRDIARIDRVVGQLQGEMQEIRSVLDVMRKEMHILHTRPPTSSNQVSESDSNTLEMLSDTLTNVSAKAGEVDGLKFQMEVLKRRIRRLEEAGSIPPPTPSMTDSQRPNQSPHSATSHPQVSIPASGWNAVNSATVKRKSTDEELQGAGKRQRSGPGSTFVHEYATANQPGQSTPTTATMTDSPTTYYNAIQPAARYFSTQNADSQGSWRPEDERDLNYGRGGSASGRKPGRPRKSSPVELGTPVWEKEAWSGSEIGPDGYYRPVGGAPTTVSPPSSERGRIVRRGSGGGMQQHFEFGREGTKRTRQRPVRNSDGVLIRKDGKPDQRSISSPMNLKKVHARKMQEAEMASTGGQSPTSPLANADTGDDEREEGASESPGSQEMTRDPQERHPEIMKQMFPNGVADDTRRMNHADYHFSRSDPKEQRETDRLQSAATVIKTEPHLTIPDSQTEPATTSIPQHDGTNDTESSVPSGPPTRRETDQTTPSTANPSESASIEAESLGRNTSDTPKQTSAPLPEEPMSIEETQRTEESAASSKSLDPVTQPELDNSLPQPTEDSTYKPSTGVESTA